MKKLVLLSALFVCGLSLSIEAQIVWLKDYPQAVKTAKETGKPLLLDFTAGWCSPCKKMDKVFWTRTDVIELAKQFVCVKVDFDQNKELKMKYGVRAIPNVTVIDPWGALFLSHVGFPKDGEQLIINKLTGVPKDFKGITEAKNLLETDRNNKVALARVAEYYQQQKLFYQSNEAYKKILAVEKNPAERENLFIIIGFNYLRIDAAEAQKAFESCQQEFPQGKRLEMAIYGHFLACERQNNFKDAQKMFDRLKKEFPKSSLLLQAEQIMPQKRQN